MYRVLNGEEIRGALLCFGVVGTSAAALCWYSAQPLPSS